MSDDFQWESVDIEELEQTLVSDDRPFLINKVGGKPNTMFSIMRDHFGGGWFGVVWEFPPDDENPIGTIRPFDTLRETMVWLMSVDLMDTTDE